MVYMRNIMELHNALDEHEVLDLRYRSGEESRILPSDELSTCRGDLRVVRTITADRCVILIDPAEVERVILRKGDLL